MLYKYIINTCFSFLEEAGKDGQVASDAELGVQFTEIFIKNQENISVLLSLLEVQHLENSCSHLHLQPIDMFCIINSEL